MNRNRPFSFMLRAVDGSALNVSSDGPGRVALEMMQGRTVEMTGVDALTLVVVLLAAVEAADPPLVPASMRELELLIESVRTASKGGGLG